MRVKQYILPASRRFFPSGILPVFISVTLLSIHQQASAQQFMIPVETEHNAMVLSVDTAKDVKNIYLGSRLSDTSEYIRMGDNAPGQHETDKTMMNSAYTPAGSRNLLEPAIDVTHSDGNKSLDLRYLSHTKTKTGDDIQDLILIMKDPAYNFEVELHYRSYYKEDVIEQWAVIRNREKGIATLNKFASANINLNAGKYWLRQYHGDWAKEMRPEETEITHGIKTLDTKLGTRADLYQPPTFMVSLDQPAHEEEGKVLMGQLEWSGNYRIDLEVDPTDRLRIIAGINNYASTVALKPNEEFITPKFLFTYSSMGKGAASRNLHTWARNHKIPNGRGSRLTLLNNWESTYFDFNEPVLSTLLKSTKKLGVDMFLLDDGWFGNRFPRNDDHAGLGDWQENRLKLPNGIGSLAKEATKDGVKFGIWIEPEMVNPKSDLYLKHPDWVVRQTKRPELYFRNQLVLDLTNPQVQEFVFRVVDSLFIKAPELAYIKWDCNAVIYNAGSVYLGDKQQSSFYVRYVQGLYKVLERIRAKYPVVPMMLCSGGGGRVDYGALQYFTEYWPSDNTDPLERIFIQWEYSYFYPAIASANHVTDWGKQPLKYRIDVAMMGKLGFDIVVDKLSPEDLRFAQQSVKIYDSIKSVVWQGDQYRLSDPREQPVASVMYVDSLKSTGVVFNYLVNGRYDESSRLPIILKGLDPAKKYRLREVNRYGDAPSPLDESKEYSGDFLMKAGYNPLVSTRRTSVILLIKKVG